jgi:hypothetical protein
MRRRALIASSLALLSCAGCGGFGGDEAPPERVTGPALLTDKQIERQPAGSPQRAVFEWWRGLQFKNAVEAAPYFSSSLHMTPTKLTKYLPAVESAFTYRPRLIDVQESGDTAIVRLLLEKTTRNPNGRLDREQKAQAFNLVRQGGSWKLSDNLYLGAIYEQFRNFAALAGQAPNSGQ